MKKRRKGGLTSITDIPIADAFPDLLAELRPPTPVQKRLIDAAAFSAEQPDAQKLLYQHTVFLPDLCFVSQPRR